MSALFPSSQTETRMHYSRSLPFTAQASASNSAFNDISAILHVIPLLVKKFHPHNFSALRKKINTQSVIPCFHHPFPHRPPLHGNFTMQPQCFAMLLYLYLIYQVYPESSSIILGETEVSRCGLLYIDEPTVTRRAFR